MKQHEVKQRLDDISEMNDEDLQRNLAFVKETANAAYCLINNLQNRHNKFKSTPVVRGKWIKKQYDTDKYYSACSVCGKNYLYYDKYNYCPNCGAKMEGGE